jgi:hypothetical protein
MKRYASHLLCAALLVLVSRANAHTHIFVSVAGNQLQIEGGHNPAIVYNLMARPVGQRYGGYYTLDEQVRVLNPNDYFSFGVYSDGQKQLDPANHPKTGADIWMEITSIIGPEGSHFGFWEGENDNDPIHYNWSYTHTSPTKSLAANQATGGYRFELSEPTAGDPPVDQDPYGHIHNRGFTVDKPGDYYVTFRLYDQSAIHQDGSGPHTPSGAYVFHFRAGPEFQIVTSYTPGVAAVLTWPSLMGIAASETGITFTVQRSLTLAAGSWVTAGTVPGTTAATVSFTDLGVAGETKAFYRLEYQWAPP